MQRTLLVVLLTVAVLAGLYVVLSLDVAVPNEHTEVTTQNEPLNADIPREEEEMLELESEQAPVTVEEKIDINAVCEGALAYTVFMNSESAEAFVAECKEGKRPEVIERFKSGLNYGVDVAI